MTESMIERVAKALWDDRYPDKEWDDLERLSYTGHARAAIEAMREPTEKMMDVAAVKTHAGLDSSEEIYQAVIDAALIWPAGSADRAGVPLARDQ